MARLVQVCVPALVVRPLDRLVCRRRLALQVFFTQACCALPLLSTCSKSSERRISQGEMPAKSAVDTRSMRIFSGISTQDHPSLADFAHALSGRRADNRRGVAAGVRQAILALTRHPN